VKSRVVLITGASGGLGQVLAVECARAGATIVAHYHDHQMQAEAVTSRIREWGGLATAVQADVTDMSRVESMVHNVVDRFGRVDILVNNAGITRDAISWKPAEESWSEVLRVNLTGAFLCAKAVLPVMRQQQWGRIINISSVVAQTGMPGTAAYAASKAGLAGLTKTLAREAAPKGVTVNCLALGYFRVGLIRTVSRELRDQIVSQIPLGRLGEPEEVAHAVRFLCDDRAAYITGQVLNVNGGLYM
jgi:3-oxoacyl-[acyl-carrier protein] reductase